MKSKSSRVAVVTGAAMGIGAAVARRLAADGAKVLIADIADAEAAATVDEIRGTGGIAEWVHADVGKGDDVATMIDTAIRLWGRLDILVNNAYNPTTGVIGNIVDLEERDFDAGMAVLVKSIYMAVKRAVPHMQAVGGGSIINMSSAHGLLGAPNFLVYETGKAAVIGMTRQMATELGPLGIRVNAICPGHIVTERIQKMWDSNPTGLAFFEDQYPLRRVGRPDEIAAAVAFLSSEESSFITGVALPVDGGLTIQLQENLAVRQGHYLQDNPGTVMPY